MKQTCTVVNPIEVKKQSDIKREITDTFDELIDRIGRNFEGSLDIAPSANSKSTFVSKHIHLFDVEVWLDIEGWDMQITMKATREL